MMIHLQEDMHYSLDSQEGFCYWVTGVKDLEFLQGDLVKMDGVLDKIYLKLGEVWEKVGKCKENNSFQKKNVITFSLKLSGGKFINLENSAGENL